MLLLVTVFAVVVVARNCSVVTVIDVVALVGIGDCLCECTGRTVGVPRNCIFVVAIVMHNINRKTKML
jgi:hypothetical protein